MKCPSGFTIIELLVVIGIVIILAAISFPVFASAKRATLKNVTAQSLRQGWISLQLYREQYGGELNYGSAVEMGLPDSSNQANDSKGYFVWDKPPCGYHPSDFKSSYILNTLCPRLGLDGAEACRLKVRDWAVQYQDNWILLYDLNCTDHSSDLNNMFDEKLGIGMLLGGSLRIKRSSGRPGEPQWWVPPD